MVNDYSDGWQWLMIGSMADDMVNKLIDKLVNSGLLVKLVNIYMQTIATIRIHTTTIHLRIHHTYYSWSQLLNLWLSWFYDLPLLWVCFLVIEHGKDTVAFVDLFAGT